MRHSLSAKVRDTFSSARANIAALFESQLVREAKMNEKNGARVWCGMFIAVVTHCLLISSSSLGQEPAVIEKVIYSFAGGTDGMDPEAGLLRDSKGNLYGTTLSGGTTGWGTVYRVTAAGTEKVLYNFTGGTDGGNPTASLIADSQGNLLRNYIQRREER